MFLGSVLTIMVLYSRGHGAEVGRAWRAVHEIDWPRQCALKRRWTTEPPNSACLNRQSATDRRRPLCDDEHDAAKLVMQRVSAHKSLCPSISFSTLPASPSGSIAHGLGVRLSA